METEEWEYKILLECKYCGSTNLEPFLDLGNMPLVNNLLLSSHEGHDVYPLRAFHCVACKMSQLDHLVNPEILYSNYNYRSGMSQTFKDHCSKQALKIINSTNKESLIVDIAANDGTLLEQIKGSRKVLGIEPATNLCDIMAKKEIPCVNKFFNYQTALDLSTAYQADIIVAQNVFAHVEDPFDFMHGVKRLLKPYGMLLIEVPWIVSTIQNMDIGQFYHEHGGYISYQGMRNFVNKFGMDICFVEYHNIHSGSLLFGISENKNLWNINIGLREAQEIEAFSKGIIEGFQEKVNNMKTQLRNLIGHQKIVGVGASAKGCILTNFCNLENNIECIYDNTPEKAGKFQPGTWIPILPFDKIKECDKKILVLAPNVQNEIIINVRKLRPDAKFIVTSPVVMELPYEESPDR